MPSRSHIMNRRTLLSATAATLLMVTVMPTRPATPSDMRTVEVYTEGSWKVTPWEALQRNDLFRLRNPDGTLADVGAEHEVSVAMGPAEWTGAPGYWGIQCDPFTFVGRDCPHKVQVFHKGVLQGGVTFLNVAANVACGNQIPDSFEHTIEFDDVRVEVVG